MKLWRLKTIAFLCAILPVVAGCRKHEPEGGKAPEKTSEKSAEPEGRVKHGTNGENIITIDEETRKTMGLQVAEVSEAQFAPEAVGFARVQDMSWIGSALNDLRAAQVAEEAAAQEFTR